MKSLLDLIKALYGAKAISSTIGTRTNVIRLPSGKLQRYLSKELNVEAASDNAALNAYNEMKELIPEVAKMNDAERLIFEGNLRRLKNKLESSNLLKEETVSSDITSLQSKVKELKQAGKELEKVTGEKATLTDVLKNFGASQQSMSRMYDEGLVRATARQILINDIRAGKIKNITVEEAINMKEPIDPFRQIYGEGALEQLDSLIPNFRNLKTEMEAEKLARSKFKFEPDETRPKESYTKEEMEKILKEGEAESKGLDYLMGVTPKKKTEIIDIKVAADKRKSVDDLIDEYNANQDRLLLTDEEGGTLITYPEYNKLKDRNDEIAKILEEKGIRSTPEVETKPEGIVIPFRKKPTEPEGKANGGIIKRENYFIGGFIPKIKDMFNKILQKQPETSTVTSEVPLTVIERYNKYLSQPSASNVDLGGGGLFDLFRRLISKVENPQTAPTNDQLYNLYRSGVESKANGGRIGFKSGSGGKKILDLISKTKKPIKEFTDDEMIAYIKKYKEEGPTLEDFTKRVNEQTGSNFTPEQLAHAYRIKVAYPHSTPIVDSQGKFIGGGLYNPPLDVSLSDRETLTKSIMQTRKAKGLSVPKKYQEELKATEIVETPLKVGEGRFTKQEVLEKIIQKTIDANPTDEYVQKTFPNFLKEIREKPELANNENVWKTFTEGFPENKRLVVYGDDTVDFFTKGENLPEGMKQTQELANTYGLSMEEARRIKQMEPENQVMEIKKLQILKSRTQNANGGLNYLMGV